jgi:hypothetical protein
LYNVEVLGRVGRGNLHEAPARIEQYSFAARPGRLVVTRRVIAGRQRQGKAASGNRRPE